MTRHKCFQFCLIRTKHIQRLEYACEGASRNLPFDFHPRAGRMRLSADLEISGTAPNASPPPAPPSCVPPARCHTLWAALSIFLLVIGRSARVGRPILHLRPFFPPTSDFPRVFPPLLSITCCGDASHLPPRQRPCSSSAPAAAVGMAPPVAAFVPGAVLAPRRTLRRAVTATARAPPPSPPAAAAAAAPATPPAPLAAAGRRVAVAAAAAAAAALLVIAPPSPLHPSPAGAEVTRADGFIPSGSASTSQTGSKKTLTRGVDLHSAAFDRAALRGVSFQSSNLRDAHFAGADLTAASFFDTDLVGVDFRGATLVQANFELANMRHAVLDDAVLVEAYVSSTTKLDGVSIVGADFTDVLLRKDQQKYLCSIASGTNSVTGVDTAESLMCP